MLVQEPRHGGGGLVMLTPQGKRSNSAELKEVNLKTFAVVMRFYHAALLGGIGPGTVIS